MIEKAVKPKFSKINILGAYQILGGLFGLALTIYLIAIQTELSFLLIAILFFAIALNSYSVFCGILIFKKVRAGLKHSWINQILQLFNFSIAGYGFQYIAGLFLSIGIDLTNSFNFKLNVGTSTWQITINQDPEIIFINFNIVALLIILFIDRQTKSIDNSELENKLDSIGIS